MNSLLLAVIAVGALALGYRFYGSKVAAWVGLDLEMTPPAVELNDGVDYVPAKHWTMLFGHHFASIAGAAPIIGPVIACMVWGWLPAMVWIVVAGIFFGAVHDYLALATSVENKGRSVGDLSELILGRTAKTVFSIFVFLALILIVAVFAAVAGQTLAGTPQVVIPTFGLIVVAILVGLLVYKTPLPLWLNTLLGLGLLFVLVVLGYHFPIELAVASPEKWWTIILLVYAMLAAVLPVTVLLQPRDHLAAGVLFIGMLLGLAGIIISHPVIQSPAVVAFNSNAQGMMWPMLCVVIACGAISGFHSLVASGTTSKQLPRMQDAQRIGYGGMIMESALAVLAVIAVTAGLYWKEVPAGQSGFVYQDLMAKGGWITTFGRGYGTLIGRIFPTIGFLIGITMLKTFVMTTLDSATRITRYICTELFADTFGIKVLKNRYAATLFVGVCAGALALGNWKAIWPVFGSANQLIAAMVLILATAYLATRSRLWVFAAVPAVLVFLTTEAALVYGLLAFCGVIEVKSLPPSMLLASVAVVLMVLGLFVAYRGVRVFWAALHQQEVVAAGQTLPEGESSAGI